MKSAWSIRALGLGTMCFWMGSIWASCSDGTQTATSGTAGGAGSSNGGSGGSGNGGSSTGGEGGSIFIPDAGCTPSTCTELNANCGPVTDPKCGGLVDCGMCPPSESCGNGGPNLCGAGSQDACAPLTCMDQSANCGQIGDGCGNTLSCGSCDLPKSCGGGGKPNQCGCSGVCAQIPDCMPGTTTTLKGKVLDPAGKNPLYHVLVYVPNNPMDPGLQPFAPGITCDVCGATAAGDPLITTYTAPDGTFTLQGVPVGTQLPLVIQIGRWRRQFKIDVTNSCGENTIADGTLTMPRNHNEGDIPRIGILTGGFDPMECVLRKMGIQDSEFTDPGAGGYINFYLASQPTAPANPFGVYAGVCPPNPYGSGAKISNATPNQDALFGMSNGQPTINQYDLVILACEGYEENNQTHWPNLGAYTTAGGRVFTTDFAYDWLARTKQCSNAAQCGAGGVCNGGICRNAGNVTENPAYPGVATWHTLQNPQGQPQTGTIDKMSNPKGNEFQQWLEIVGVSGQGSGSVSLNPVFHNSDAVVAPTQQWLYWGAQQPIHFTFNTPVGAPAANQCGRMVYSDWHADALGFGGNYPSCPFNLPKNAPYYSHGMTFPSECDNNPMTPQEAILEFMLFDLTACVEPYVPLCTPTTCMAQGVECGPAGDGCGNLIDCGQCPMGQYCGGGGPGKCGSMNTCMPATCMSQGIECGQAGDGCGNVLNCGNCATGAVCGLNAPGKCGTLN
ncbi:MAG TPA: hypothetical protein PKA58_01440 [Polyangium sp.]|nr:hypothetical protein [Polyangium sp.]